VQRNVYNSHVKTANKGTVSSSIESLTYQQQMKLLYSRVYQK